MKVFFLTTGSGGDGDEWGVISVHSTLELATIAKNRYSAPIMRRDGSTYSRESTIEEWVVDERPSEDETVSPLTVMEGK